MSLSNAREYMSGGVHPAHHPALDIPDVMMEEVERVCPECGAAMIEFDRLAEDGALFIWYACSRESCTGQWLTKKALRMCGA
jgi:hypothetical protein